MLKRQLYSDIDNNQSYPFALYPHSHLTIKEALAKLPSIQYQTDYFGTFANIFALSCSVTVICHHFYSIGIDIK